MRYEYLESEVDTRKMNVSDVLNIGGRDGWRLVHVYPPSSQLSYYRSFILEREIPEVPQANYDEIMKEVDQLRCLDRSS